MRLGGVRDKPSWGSGVSAGPAGRTGRYWPRSRSSRPPSWRRGQPGGRGGRDCSARWRGCGAGRCCRPASPSPPPRPSSRRTRPPSCQRCFCTTAPSSSSATSQSDSNSLQTKFLKMRKASKVQQKRNTNTKNLDRLFSVCLIFLCYCTY